MSFLSSFLKGVGKAVTGVVGNIPIVGDIANSMMSDYENQQAAKQQIGMSKDLMQYQNDLNMANWETQNAYNTPQNQLQRIIDAGLNPLAFGLDGNSAGSPATVSGAASPDISSLLNYQMSLSLAKSQLKTQALDQQAKKYENKALEAESDARVAEATLRKKEAEADIRFGDKYRVPKPDDEHDWLLDSADNWYYIDDQGNKVLYSGSNPQGSNIRDILRNVRYKRELDEAETVRYNKLKTLSEGELAMLNSEIQKVYGFDMAARQLDRLVAEIANIEARTDLTNEQKFALEMDNDIWRSLGLGGKGVELVLRALLGFMK